MNCIIIDDDAISRLLLESIVKKTEILTLVGSFESAAKAIQHIEKDTIDLIFLDIEMPEMSGFDFMKALSYTPEVIIVSSKEKYALESYNFNVTDYLVKPLSDQSRFLKAVMKANTNIQNLKSETLRVEEGNIFMKVDSLYVKVDFEDICYIEAFGDYVKVITEQKIYTVYTTMRHIETKLPSDCFMRIHRSYIVRLDQIKNLASTTLEIASKIIPISNSYKEGLMQRLNIL